MCAMVRRSGDIVIPAEETQWALPAWREVLERIPDRHPFLTPEWQCAWWEHFGVGELSVTTLTVCEEAVAVAATHLDDSGVVRFLGGEDLTDYPGPAIAAGCVPAAADELLCWLQSSDLDWRELDVRNARSEEGLADELQAAAGRAQLPCSVCDDEPVAILALPASWEEYLASLSRHSRREVRRKQNRLSRELPEAKLRTADAGTLATDLDAFFFLHRLARGRKGAFMSEQIERFFRRIACDFSILATLRLDVLEAAGRPLAITLGFQSPQTFYLYNMAYDPAVASLSPGIVQLALLIERAIGEGLERFDFLRGLERYKLELGASPSRLQRVRVRAR
jgi:CelD/BcsL family acetyltransferase involved in cellulose biosynthesis